MPDKLMIGLWRFIIKLPPSLWEKKIAGAARAFEARAGRFTEDHRRVHHFVVRELPAAGGPLAPEVVADGLGLPLDKVTAILDDLEKNMTYLWRNERGEVIWAYPVTVEPTPHRVTFSTGERLFAA
ncbi:MAG: hypothetical protein KJ621_16715 [Proteobacteria bacterium]|nr:hypothetical protein [Pseudomonadota bacterium]MBU1742731.1 hypothetical protein [Pseudomonadota bacterium]